MIDTHCHLTYDGLIERIDDVVANAAKAGVARMITVGTTPDDAAGALRLAERFGNVWFAAGLHPGHSAEWPDLGTLRARLLPLLAHPRCVALGETGLDRHYPDPPIETQRRAFACQLEMALELPAKPVIIHNREATDDTLAMIREHGVPGPRFVFHCFTGGDAELDAILDLGAMVSFTGITTFGSAKALAGSAARVPLERIMIETDSPYLAPEPHRKVKPNEPRHVAEVARFLAAKRGLGLEEFVAATTRNAEQFFGLPRG